MERDFKGVWIPKEIWLDDRLNALDKIIFVEIDSLCSEERGCFASNKYLAEFCQCSETKISKAISKLIDLEYLYVVSFNGRQRELQSCLAKNARQNNKKCKADEQEVQGSIYIDNNNKDNNKDNKKVSKKDQEKTDKQTFDEIIETYTSNKELQKLLKEYLKVLKCKKALTTNFSLKILLDNLSNFAYTDEEKILVVKTSIIKGWTSFYPLNNNLILRQMEIESLRNYDIEAYEKYNVLDEQLEPD